MYNSLSFNYITTSNFHLVGKIVIFILKAKRLCDMYVLLLSYL